MKPDDILKNGLKQYYQSNHCQEGIFTRKRITPQSQAVFAFDLGWFSKNGKPNVIAMYAYGDTAVRLAREVQTGDVMICFFYIDAFKGKGYVGVRGILYDYRIYGNHLKTAQYLSSEFEKSVTNTLSSGDEIRDITDQFNF